MNHDDSEPIATASRSSLMLYGLRCEVARESARKRVPRALKFAMGLLYLLPLPFLVVHHPYSNEIRNAVLCVVFVFFVAKMILEQERRQHTNQKCALIQELREDARCVGLLAMIAHNRLSDEPVFYATLHLKTLLPRLRAENARDFTPQTMDATLRLLNSHDSELVIATCKGLEQVGDMRALSAVMLLAEQTQNLAVQGAAQECLPYLQARARQQTACSTLLRPSQATRITPETLLRPAPPQYQANAPEHLLRAHNA